MKTYRNLSYPYKKHRLSILMAELDAGRMVSINGLFIEEINFLRNMYGDMLKQNGHLLSLEGEVKDK